MLLLLEGPDWTGKTTLARALVERLQAEGEPAAAVDGTPPRIRGVRGTADRTPLEEYELELQWYRPGRAPSAVVDRWHWSEEVYGPVLREGSRFDAWDWWHVEAALLARGAVVVWVRADELTLRERAASRGDDFVEVSHLPALLDGYSLVAGRSRLPLVEVRSDHDEDALSRVLSTGRAAEDVAAPLAAFPSYVGPPHPDDLLLGERRLAPVYRGAFASTSGRYLLRALGDVDPPPPDLGLANALEEDVPALLEVLGYPRVCALGRQAQRSLQAAGVTHGAVPHPQYRRRFHHAADGEYRDAIYRALAGAEDLIEELTT